MLAEHLHNTAERAKDCLYPAGLGNAAKLAGLLHDMGKYTARFQCYLEEGDPNKRGTVIHSFQGCRYLLDRFHEEDAQASELLAYAVAAHHGVFDCIDSGSCSGFNHRKEKKDTDHTEAVQAFHNEFLPADQVRPLFQLAAEELHCCLNRIDAAYPEDDEYCFQVGLLARLVLSAVIEGDRRDTASFTQKGMSTAWPRDMRAIWATALIHAEQRIACFPSDTPIAKVRRHISDQCKQFAQRPSGIYRLNVPTGSGKTVSSLRYALSHAEKWNKTRLIFISPLLSILEQNAKVIRDFVGNDSLILEHHSNVIQTESTQNELDERELLVQSWDSPIIITTMVQFLNTLFCGKTTSIRRFQALCDSVIVIDEVQTVPTKMLGLFTMAIRFLSEQCGASIVLCSATQPTLSFAEHPLHESVDIVLYQPTLWEAFERTRIHTLPDLKLEKIPALIMDLMKETDSLLVICNKKSQAAYLFGETQSSDYISYHLSASMCMQHRRDTIDALKISLQCQGKKTLCIATQVIEAGVDISFAQVLRFSAGMDSVIQSAGRCNRNGESAEPSNVYILNCSDESLGLLKDIQRGKTASIELLECYRRKPERFFCSLSSDSAIAYYYKALYREMKRGEQEYYLPQKKTSLFALLSTNPSYVVGCSDAENLFLRQAFRSAGQAFTVFDQETVDVVVPYGKGEFLIKDLCKSESLTDETYREAAKRQLADYTISLYAYQKKALEEQGGLAVICGGSILTLLPEFYEDKIGLMSASGKLPFWEV